MQLVATCARGTEAPLTGELAELGAANPEVLHGAVAFGGDLGVAYRVCLWSRIASRVILRIASFEAPDEGALYEGVRAIRWAEQLGPEQTIAVTAVASGRPEAHTHFLALRTKDAIVDRLRDETGARPNVDTERPDVRVHLYVEGDRATVGIDLSGEPLHRRGYRPRDAQAPLRENLAAAMLILAGWPAMAAAGKPLVDLLCGSGTLLVEAAWMAGDVAPGILRRGPGSPGFRGHDRGLFDALVREARVRRDAGRARIPPIVGFDASPGALAAARESVERAGLGEHVRLQRQALDDVEPPAGAPGLVITNPPYGERLGDATELFPIYRTLGDVLRRRFTGWQAFVLAGNRALAKHLGLRARRRHVLWNGPIECRLLDLPISAAPARAAAPGWRRTSAEAEMLRNRLKKNRRRLGRAAERAGVTCYRVYDADIPEYNVAIDLYEGAAVVQEYEPPPKVDAALAERRLADVLDVAAAELEIDPKEVVLKVRRRQRGGGQVEKRSDLGELRTVQEGGHRFLVNLRDRLDTGLYLDQRLVRAEIAALARGRRFLNLFAYTASATVYAAKGGATASTSVDLSSSALRWARRNLEANGIDPGRHELVRAECTRWLREARGRYGVVLLAPPVYSRSKAMEGDLDIARDHPALLERCAALLEPDGVILFVTHARKLELALPRGLAAEEISGRTVPPDFARSPHRAWLVRRLRSRGGP